MSFIKKLLDRNKIQTQVFDISLEKMQTAFQQIHDQAGWDTNEKMYWGYYFLDHDTNKLETFGNQLELLGHKVIEKRKTNQDDLFLLHIEDHTSHSPKSLFNHCQNLARLARENKIEVFDGWDVEKNSLTEGYTN